MLGLTRQAACELACYGIRACAVAPGITATPMSGMWVRERGNTEGRQEGRRDVWVDVSGDYGAVPGGGQQVVSGVNLKSHIFALH